MSLQHRTSPLPQPAHLALSRQLPALTRHSNRSPSLESHIRATQVDERAVRVHLHRLPILSRRWWCLGDAVVDKVPVDCRDPAVKELCRFLLFLLLDNGVDAACFLKCGDAAAHVGGASGEFVVRGCDGPVEGVGEGDEAVDGADGFVVEVGGG